MAGLIFFEIFSYYWTSEVINNVILATLAGGPFGCTFLCVAVRRVDLKSLPFLARSMVLLWTERRRNGMFAFRTRFY